MNISRILKYAVLVVLTLLFVSPLLFMVITSLKDSQEAVQTPPTWWPDPLTFQAYERILGAPDTPVIRWFLNSLVAAAANAALVVATSSLAAYALARLQFRGKKVVSALIISTLFVPPVILVVPNYEIVGRLYWLDTLIAIIVPTAAGAFGVFFLRQFFIGLPKELEESAYLDGANRWQVFTRIVLPLSKPALATLGLLSFLTNWNDFLWPVYVLFSPESQTLPAGLSTLQEANAVRYDLLTAGAVIASVPVLAIYVLAQRYIIEGVSRSGLKG
jgi:multiple sugar transport system permease protein